MRSFIRIARTESAALGQKCVWVVVDEVDGLVTEEVLVKVPEDAGEPEIQAAVERLIAVDEARRLLAAEEDAQLAAIRAELEQLQARFDALIGAGDSGASEP